LRSILTPAGVASGVLVFLGAVEVPDAAIATVVETGAWHRLQVGDENFWDGGADVDVMDEVDVVSGADTAQEGDGSLIVGGAAIVVGSHVAEMQLLLDRRRSTLGGRGSYEACVREGEESTRWRQRWEGAVLPLYIKHTPTDGWIDFGSFAVVFFQQEQVVGLFSIPIPSLN
jgi:hypothetical protein